MDPVALSVLSQRLIGIAEQMGTVLERSAYSPNIKERRDFSCAIFDDLGRLLAQAAHMPVHLGSMEGSVQAAHLAYKDRMGPGDMVILNDPYAGGSHLPDLTLVAPVFKQPTGHRNAPADGEDGTDGEDEPNKGVPIAFVANRAHHADIGGKSPGSLPADSEFLEEEGVLLEPLLFVNKGRPVEKVWQMIKEASRTPRERQGDLQAQVAANIWGCRRTMALMAEHDPKTMVEDLLSAAGNASRHILSTVPKGNYKAGELIHDHRDEPHPLEVNLSSDGKGALVFDLSGTSSQYPGNLNAPLSVTRAAVRYTVYMVMRVLEPRACPPSNHGAFTSVSVKIPQGSLLNPVRPSGSRSRGHPAVAAGNVETSQRVVDLLLSAFAQALPGIIPAQSQGTMNNLLIGHDRDDSPFAYYETLGGGCGATPVCDGASGTHSHMTNTLNTPVEALEHAYPLRVKAYRIRSGTGGHGTHRGGDGLERKIELLAPATLTLVSSRRHTQPCGIGDGGPGLPGEQWVERDGQCLPLSAKTTMELREGDVVVVRTPGGGGWGKTL